MEIYRHTVAWKAIAILFFMLCSKIIYSQPVSEHDYLLNKAPWQWVNQNQSSGEISVLLLGDTNIQNRKIPGSAWEHMLPTLLNGDIRFLNLEGPFAGASIDPWTPDIPHKAGWVHSAPSMVQALVDAKIDAVGVANNVTYPWQALVRSTAVLDSAGIKYTGGGRNLKEAHQPVIIEEKGIKVGFIQYTALYWPYNHAAEENKPGVAGLKVSTYYQPPPNLDKPGQPPVVVTIPDEKALKLMIQDIQSLRQKADVVIISFHWGVSGTEKITDYQGILGKAAIDAGADLVMGHGPHVFQPIEIYKGKPIFYCLGNSAFDWIKKIDSVLDGLMVRVTAGKQGITGISAIPLSRDKTNVPVLLDPNSGRGAELYKTIVNLSKDFGTSLAIRNKEIVIQ